MKLGKMIKTAIKWAPIVYPIVRKIFDKGKTTTPLKRR